MAEIGLLLCLVMAAFSLVFWVTGAAIAWVGELLDLLISCGKRAAKPDRGRHRRPLITRYPATALGTRPYDYLLVEAARHYFRRVNDRHQEILAALPAPDSDRRRALDDFDLARAHEMATLGFLVGRIVASRESEDEDTSMTATMTEGRRRRQLACHAYQGYRNHRRAVF